jgi:hypothetical protein
MAGLLLKNFNKYSPAFYGEILCLYDNGGYDIIASRRLRFRTFSAILSVFSEWQIICIFAGRFEETTNLTRR